MEPSLEPSGLDAYMASLARGDATPARTAVPPGIAWGESSGGESSSSSSSRQHDVFEDLMDSIKPEPSAAAAHQHVLEFEDSNDQSDFRIPFLQPQTSCIQWPELSEAQKRCHAAVLDAARQARADGKGRVVFGIGKGGCGKSRSIRFLHSEMSTPGSVSLNFLDAQSVATFFTALTGSAAIQLECGCTTLHSAVHLGRGDSSIRDTLRAVSNWENVDQLEKIDVLVIDEISMCSSRNWTLLEAILRNFGKSKGMPYGGVVVNIYGDPLQLPPTIGDAERAMWAKEIDSEITSFCVHSNTFQELTPERQAELRLLLKENPRKVFRQSEIWKELTDFEQEEWDKRMRSEIKPYFFQSDEWLQYGCTPVHFDFNFRQGNGDPYSNILARIRIGEFDFEKDMSILAPRILRPHDEIPTFEDGIAPTIVYTTRSSTDKYNLEKLDALPSKRQVTYKASRRIFEPKNRNIQSFFDNVPAADELMLKVGAQVVLVVNMMDSGLVNGSRGVVTRFFGPKQMPVVRFTNGTVIPIDTEYKFVLERTDSRGMRHIVAYVKQVPLRLAWAWTLHKCQGMTLTRAVFHLGRTFGFHMIYVALSRTTLDGLYMRDFDPKKIVVDRVALAFVREMEMLAEARAPDFDVLVAQLDHLFGQRSAALDKIRSYQSLAREEDFDLGDWRPSPPNSPP